MTKPRTVRAFSAGGVVYRRPTSPQPDDGYEVVLVGRAWENFWVLPKGTPLPGEAVQDVARREVAEETGITARIVDELGSIHYWFSRHGVRFNKEVFYYLMEAVGGDVSLHDQEYDDSCWFPLRDALGRIAYPNEAQILRLAVKKLTGGAPPASPDASTTP
jgi:8-oxo-dGTP pyrophosphatase MutT (NUDIX family)